MQKGFNRLCLCQGRKDRTFVNAYTWVILRAVGLCLRGGVVRSTLSSVSGALYNFTSVQSTSQLKRFHN